MKTQLMAAIAVCATLALSACGAPTTPDFVQKAAMSDMYEIEAGKIATQKGQSDAVKQYGTKMTEMHTQMSNELKSIVEADKINVQLPTKLDDKHQKMIDDLNEAKAEDFDKTYIDQQESAHKTAVDLFEDYAESGDNGAVKAFAAKTLPIIKEHLNEAEKLDDATS